MHFRLLQIIFFIAVIPRKFMTIFGLFSCIAILSLFLLKAWSRARFNWKKNSLLFIPFHNLDLIFRFCHLKKVTYKIMNVKKNVRKIQNRYLAKYKNLYLLVIQFQSRYYVGGKDFCPFVIIYLFKNYSFIHSFTYLYIFFIFL